MKMADERGTSRSNPIRIKEAWSVPQAGPEEVADPPGVERAGAADQTVDLVSLVEEEFSEEDPSWP